ncbi:MAG: T9SS type A sorting domain-containing protein [candidate division WOR-3 bacterium]|nr:MAG: T9SS type A sorting domain-containing protein [candidate division WOR-3 bacterium]
MFRQQAFLVDTHLVYVPAGEWQGNPAVAFDGTNYLLVWEDERYGTTDIYGARITPSGTVLDPAGFPISRADRHQRRPSVIFGGTDYLVVWEDYRNSSYDIFGARVTTDGVVLDTSGIAISSAYGYQFSPCIAYDGTNFLVVWEHDGADFDLYGTRVSNAGTVLDPSGIAIANGPAHEYFPEVAFDGTNYLIAWKRYYNNNHYIYGTRITPGGTVLDPSGFLISYSGATQGDPSLAFDGTNFLVAWEDSRNGSMDIYAARITSSGTVLDPVGIGVSTDGSAQYTPVVTFNGEDYVIVWRDYRATASDIYGARVTQTGMVLDPAGIPVISAPNSQAAPACASDGVNCLAVCWDYRTIHNYNIIGARVTQDGTVLDEDGIMLSTSANWQEHVSIASDGDNFLLVWEDTRDSDSSDIYGMRIGQDGTVLDPEGIPISTAENRQRYPAVTFNGTNYFVIWHDHNDDIYGTRVTTDGTVLDHAGIPVAIDAWCQTPPTVTSDGSNFLVIWDWQQYEIRGARVSGDGTVLDPSGFLIAVDDSSRAFPAASFDGTNFFVVWTDNRNVWSYDIYGTRVSQNGTALDPGGIPVSTIPTFNYQPSVSFDGTNYFVIWDFNSDIHGIRVDQDGTVLDPSDIIIVAAPSEQRSPAVAYDGVHYQVIWQDLRSGTYPDIYGKAVSTSGVPLDEYEVCVQPGQQVQPVLASSNSDTLCYAFAGFTDSINALPANAMRIWAHITRYESISERSLARAVPTSSYLDITPNPFRTKTVITIDMEQSAESTALKIYDITGRLVNFYRPTPNALRTTLQWNGTDNQGNPLRPGVYFVQLQTGDICITGKICKID